MKYLRNGIALLFGLLMSMNVLAMETEYAEKSLINPTEWGLKEGVVDNSFLQLLKGELVRERKREIQLSQSLTEFAVKHREVLLFGDAHMILNIWNSTDYPYKNQSAQLSQCRQRIINLEEQLPAEILLQEYILVKVSFPKPHPDRWGNHPLA